MIVHRQQTVAMSELVPSKTRHPELVKLSQDIIKTQSTEISWMLGWQKSWFK